MDLTKICRLCQRELSVKKFPTITRPYKDRTRSYFYYRCYDCHRKANREYNHKNRERRLITDAAYRARNKAKKKQYNFRYRRLFVEPMYKPKDLQPFIEILGRQ